MDILAVIEPYADCRVRMVNPMTNMPRTNLVIAFQGLQLGRKPTNPEIPPVTGNVAIFGERVTI